MDDVKDKMSFGIKLAEKISTACMLTSSVEFLSTIGKRRHVRQWYLNTCILSVPPMTVRGEKVETRTGWECG